MSEITQLSTHLNLSAKQVDATVKLLDEGNTVPFIARYRKEATGGLSDEQVSDLATGLKKLRAINDRRETIKKIIGDQGKLSEKLARALNSAETLTELEDLYTPYKKKRQTRGMKARALGLMPLAGQILRQPVTNKMASDFAFDFIKKDTPTAAHVWKGARDIVAEYIGDNARVRQTFRRRGLQAGKLVVTKTKNGEDPKNLYELYYDFSIPVQYVKPHQILAINRGEQEKILRVKLELSDHDKMVAIRNAARPNPRSPLHEQLVQAMEDAMKRLLLPSAERDVRRELTEFAEGHAISVFAKNVRDLLTQPPITGHTILALDPGFRTGCKVTTIDPTGKVLSKSTVFLHQKDDMLRRLSIEIKRNNVTLIAIGNGTASRETEQIVAELTRTFENVKYLVVNEAGASVYSASPIARQELPDMDVSLRGAVSIGRRVQDPLAELVKIDPKSIGVGLYQHDVNQKQLSDSLANVVELVVNRVGVDLNTASPALLTHVAGIGPKLAEKIVAFRDANGPFDNRSRLNKVPGLGKKAFQQCAGFLRIRNSSNSLDSTAIHPESYAAAKKVLQRANITLEMDEVEKREALKTLPSVSELAEDLGTGQPTLQDILEQIVKPGRDPREDLTPPMLRSDVLSMEDLRTGLVLHGTVRNVVDFGAFVDIGVKRDGLLHRSATPKDVELAVGQTIEVAIKEVDSKRGRISLDWAATD
ncbi:MAG: helix-hairpin-helix domain-containing protein [Candidatus Promineifilaceae bacterium]